MSCDFGEGIENLKIVILTTNTTDMTLQTDPKFEGKVIQPGKAVANASAEHGLAMALQANGSNILYDFGGLALTVLRNLEILKIKPESFQKAVLSHGHFDHFGTMVKLLPLLGPGKELILSPEMYKQKVGFLGDAGERVDSKTLGENYRALKREGKVAELPALRKKFVMNTITENNLTLTETNKPVELAPGVWTSGEIEIFDESELTSNLFLKLDKKTFQEDNFRDEIAIYAKIKDKGLVVLTGCGHTGIMNTIKHGQKISGEDKIYAIIGGFHLQWSTGEHIDKVVHFIDDLQPEIVCGMHCTGFQFNAKLWDQIPQVATLGVVGTQFNL
jgi:7,8-dihydropterin-6-yl-methyl-4-(beta-D-ribofuranosyl)aminobenzene 5'-phosphate synthase